MSEPNQITVEQASLLREQTEGAVLNLLQNLAAQTGATVLSLDLQHIHTQTLESTSPQVQLGALSIVLAI